MYIRLYFVSTLYAKLLELVVVHSRKNSKAWLLNLVIYNSYLFLVIFENVENCAPPAATTHLVVDPLSAALCTTALRGRARAARRGWR
jgi:hypothetical protein